MLGTLWFLVRWGFPSRLASGKHICQGCCIFVCLARLRHASFHQCKTSAFESRCLAREILCRDFAKRSLWLLPRIPDTLSLGGIERPIPWRDSWHLRFVLQEVCFGSILSNFACFLRSELAKVLERGCIWAFQQDTWTSFPKIKYKSDASRSYTWKPHLDLQQTEAVDGTAVGNRIWGPDKCRDSVRRQMYTLYTRCFNIFNLHHLRTAYESFG